jgi:hypothetical protein
MLLRRSKAIGQITQRGSQKNMKHTCIALLLLWGLYICVDSGHSSHKPRSESRTLVCYSQGCKNRDNNAHSGMDPSCRSQSGVANSLAFSKYCENRPAFLILSKRNAPGICPHVPTQKTTTFALLNLRGGASRGLMPEPSISDDAEDQGLVRVSAFKLPTNKRGERRVCSTTHCVLWICRLRIQAVNTRQKRSPRIPSSRGASLYSR